MTAIIKVVNNQIVFSAATASALAAILLPQVALAQTAQGLSEAARDLSVAARVGSEAAETSAEAHAAAALAAAEASGDVIFFDTKAAADAALGGLAEGDVIEVFVDEDQADARTRYKVVSAALVLKANLSSSANITYAPAGTGAGLRPVQSWAREAMITPGDYLAAYDGVTDDTANIQAGLDYLGTLPNGGAMKFPRGAIKHGQLTIPANVKIYHEGCETVPLFNTTTTQKLYNFTSAGCSISGLWVEGYAATLSAGIAKYIIFGDGCDDLLIEDILLDDITASDGLLGLTNLAVTHGMYLRNCRDPRIVRGVTRNVSGATAFAVATDGLDIDGLRTTDNGWYTIEIGNDNVAYQVRNARLRNTSVNSGMFGGIGNVMSQFTNVASTTSLAIGTGSKVFTVAADQTGFIPGRILTVRSATGTNYMQGPCVSYSGTTLTIDVTDTVGSGTYADWSIGSAQRNDRWGLFDNVEFSGPCNYGAGLRLLSPHKLRVRGCTFRDITAGALHLAGEPVGYITLDRRGISEGLTESGPAEDVIFEGNIMEAGAGTLGHIGYAINHQLLALRDPHKNIQINGGIVRSLDADHRFRNAVIVNGGKSGIEKVIVKGIQASVLTDTVSGRTTGAFAFASTNVEGQLNGVQVTGNQITDIGTPSASSHTGIYFQSEIGDLQATGNRLENFFYGIRTGANLWSVRGLYDNEFVRCTTDLVLSSPVNKVASYGTAPPTTGTFARGHLHFNSSVTASVSNGWRCSVAGGAVSLTWSAGLSGSSVAASRQLRNSSGVVYSIITAGGGVTADQPVHTTIGEEVTGADGYKYRCISATTARWVPFAADGAAVAIP